MQLRRVRLALAVAFVGPAVQPFLDDAFGSLLSTLAIVAAVGAALWILRDDDAPHAAQG